MKRLAHILTQKETGLQFFSVSPGMVDTPCLSNSGISSVRGMHPDNGIRGHLFCGSSKVLERRSGDLWHNNVMKNYYFFFIIVLFLFISQ